MTMSQELGAAGSASERLSWEDWGEVENATD